MTGIVNVTGARSGVIGTITATAAAGFNSSTFLDQGTLFSRASANTLNIPDLGGMALSLKLQQQRKHLEHRGIGIQQVLMIIQIRQQEQEKTFMFTY
jgi:hypothetical protein